jgi:hypothetical protein
VADSVGPPSDAGQEGHFPGPPGQPPAAATPPAKLRPARAWYWVALVVFLAGAGWLGGGLYLLVERVDSFQRVPLPGEGEVSLDHSGGYVIYYEGPGAEGREYPRLHGQRDTTLCIRRGARLRALREFGQLQLRFPGGASSLHPAGCQPRHVPDRGD